MWITSRHKTKCRECSEEITEGDRVVYAQDEKKTYCKSCGEGLEGSDTKDQSSLEELSKRARQRLRTKS